MNDNQQNSSTIVQLVGDTAHEYSIATSQWSGGQGMTCLTKAVQQALDALATAKTTMLDLYGGWRCQNVIKACEDAHTALLAASKLTQAERHLTVTTNESGEAVLVSWQDDEHQILEVVWERRESALQLAAPVDERAEFEAWDGQIRKTVEAVQDPDTVPAFHNGYYTLTPGELRRVILALRLASYSKSLNVVSTL